MNNSSSIYSFKVLDESYNEEMLDILHSSPIDSGGFKICFDREPNIFTLAKVKYSPAIYIGFFRKQRLQGFVMMGYHDVFINGIKQNVFHTTDLYTKQEARNNGFYYKASSMIFEKAQIGYAIIMQGNSSAMGLVSRRYDKFPEVPFSKVVGTLDVKNILITFKRKESGKYKIRKAVLSDISAIVSLLQKEYSKRLFGMYIDKDTFFSNLEKRPEFSVDNYYLAEKDGDIVGVCAAWDTSSFKQNRVLKLSRRLKLSKIVYDVLAYLFNFSPLPGKGACFKDMYITDNAVNNRSPDIMKALLTRVYNDCRRKKYNNIIWGSCEEDPLLKATRGFFRQSIKSHIILASKDSKHLLEDSLNMNLPYVNVALL